MFAVIPPQNFPSAGSASSFFTIHHILLASDGPRPIWPSIGHFGHWLGPRFGGQGIQATTPYRNGMGAKRRTRAIITKIQRGTNPFRIILKASFQDLVYTWHISSIYYSINLKRLVDSPQPAETLSHAALERLQKFSGVYMGVNVAALIEDVTNSFEGPRGSPACITLVWPDTSADL